MKKLLALSMFVTVASAKNLNYGGLCDDLRRYKKDHKDSNHAGHLWEHTVWVTKAMERMFATKSKWVEGIDTQYEYAMVIAAFLHDVGKAGDLEFFYALKPSHPQVGVGYLTGKGLFYKNIKKNTVIFADWFKANDVTPEDQKAVIVLAGMHQQFGIMLKRLSKKPEAKDKLFQQFFKELTGYCEQADYNNGTPDDQIVRMSIALCVADMQGMFPVSFTSKYFPDLADEPQTILAKPLVDPLLVDTVGFIIAQELIQYGSKRVFAYLHKN